MNKYFLANTALCIILTVITAFALTNISTALTPKGLLVNDIQPSPEVKPLLKKVVLETFDVGEDENHQIYAIFQVKNNADQDVRNLKIDCDFSDGAGRYLDREQWLLADRLAAGTRKKYTAVDKRFVHTKAISITCNINDLDIVNAPFITLARSVNSDHEQPTANGHSKNSVPGSH